MKSLFIKYRELISYVFFGALTTAVNFAVFYALQAFFHKGDLSYLLNNAAAWLISVIFAYVTNKLFVFKAKDKSFSTVTRELFEFFGARIFSFGIEELGLWLFVDTMGLKSFSFDIFRFTVTGELLAKLILAVIVVILNYFFSKFIIFKSKTKKSCCK